MGNENKNNPKEVEVTAEKALEFIWAAILIVSAVVALFSLIWCRWHLFKAALTVFFALLLGTALGFYLSHLFDKLSSK